jgi:hypothetical protein
VLCCAGVAAPVAGGLLDLQPSHGNSDAEASAAKEINLRKEIIARSP